MVKAPKLFSFISIPSFLWLSGIQAWFHSRGGQKREVRISKD